MVTLCFFLLSTPDGHARALFILYLPPPFPSRYPASVHRPGEAISLRLSLSLSLSSFR